ncbi:oligosaccharide flippase family protein [Deinococcus radiodurans]|uniref:oligosaccharide flippase family protein n=1 Tax=Deinococcus radiodurans TaxID=1299 RepID=UPI000AF19A3B|nr:lipopolysaccharide biosynthesis protein [Deinococcus radiodurans]QIP30462.1 lipopolysaccharide biosynthesis protein [Deinococcus radiodurans]QIP33178.1 lipopolysaccharide biosynthesis protein [Deinococcus radiodurans]UID71623.1 O-antigen transporter RfbX, putative [Deinococcus radiodurans R1 = ATCC 13939 = DSM 20539]UTA52257.1 lipopolysaccharide biosynthesis protein [Deinococcus radiodurans]
MVVYGAFFLRAFSFILLLPLFTRVIEPATWGGVLAAQALAMWLIVLIDFGFTLSLSRKVAINRENLTQVRVDVGNVYSAKLMLLIPAAFICWLTTQFGLLERFPALAWWALAWAAAQSFSPLWYYQAVEKMYYFSTIEIMGRLFYIILSIWLIKSTADAYMVLFLQVVALLIVHTITLVRLWREISGFILSFLGGWNALREGIILSGFTVLTSIYTAASTFLFSIFAPAGLVPQYGNADRLVRSGLSLLGPLNQILLPKSARAFAESPSKGFSLAKHLLYLYSLIGILGLFLGWLFAPLAVKLLFGSQYGQSLIYIRHLLVLFPLTAINTVIVYHILIPSGKERLVTRIYALISILALILIGLLVPTMGGKGMIYAVVIPEVIALFQLGIYSIKIEKESQGIFPIR